MNNTNLDSKFDVLLSISKFILVSCWLILALGCTSTSDSTSRYTVILESKSGLEIEIGTVEKHGVKYEFERDDSKFKDFFLSMKEMKCLEGPEIFCHIHYPYPQQSITADNNLVWLSHDLLFMYKRPDQFGARLRQGVFFEIVQEIVQGQKIYKGIAYSVDLDDLASPPESFDEPPIQVIELEQLETQERWLPFLKIVPVE